MIIIVRHGETKWNLEKRKQGHKNSNLTKKGRDQAIKVADFLKKKNIKLEKFKFYSSPLKRVVDYSKIVTQNLDYKLRFKKKIKLSNLLKEHKFGIWEGKTDAEIKTMYPNQLKKRRMNRWEYVIPGGESYKLLDTRVNKFIKKINTRGNYIIFTHEMVSKVFRGILMNYKSKKTLSLSHKNSSIYIYKNKSIKEYKLK